MRVEYDPGFDYEVFVVKYYQYEDSSTTISVFTDPDVAYKTFIDYLKLGWQPVMEECYLRKMVFDNDVENTPVHRSSDVHIKE